jgi:AraC-like DNA-binding protein
MASDMTSKPDPRGYLYKRIVRAKLFVDTHFSESIGVRNIASEAFLSRYHFIRLFKRIYNRTPHQYLTAVRIERAKELLHSGIPVSDVCYSVGFESESSFTGLFKRRVGRTPSAYQNRHYEIRAEMARNPLRFVPACFVEKQGWAEKSNFGEPAD